MEIKSYVFFDIETTGLPWQEKNQTKIIELSFVATTRKDIINTKLEDIPPVRKLTQLFNPKRPIHPEVVALTGISNELLQHAPTFHMKVNSLISFLKDLPQPTCLVAHNGNSFDYKIFLAECYDTGISMPEIYCVDSLVGFRKLLKDSSITYQSLKKIEYKSSDNELLNDDDDDNSGNSCENEWPDITGSTEDWQEIDEICELSLSGISVETEDDTEGDSEEEISRTQVRHYRSYAINKVFGNKTKTPSIAKSTSTATKSSYKLVDLYKRLLNKEEKNAHRAENDCLMLLHCVVALKNEFLPWADTSCKLLKDIAPLKRY